MPDGLENLAERQERLKQSLQEIVDAVNDYLSGTNHPRIEEHLRKIEPGGAILPWFHYLRETGKPHRTDPKSLGTYIEKLIKAEMSRVLDTPITGSSALGVDILELSLNLKATSGKSPQSSEPFLSAYDRVLGAKFDVLVFIYNGEEYLESNAANLKIVRYHYYEKAKAADAKLCEAARLLRSLVQRGAVDVETGKRGLRSIVYAKKGGAQAKHYRAFRLALESGETQQIQSALAECERIIFEKVEPLTPNADEWARFLSSPLNGEISISFALQWRYQYPKNG